MTDSRLLLIRHAEPQDDAQGRVYGSLDVGLSPRGREHARRLAAALEPVEAVYSSPRRRALETAEQLSTGVVVDERLREIDFGELEGRPYEEIRRERPELFRRWMETPTEVEFPGGESFAAVRARAVDALESLRPSHRTAAIVAHGGVVRAMLAHCLEMPDTAIFRLDVPYCSVSVVDWLDGTPLVRSVNRSWSRASVRIVR
jgi:broad specificity phosphatase PhoE